MRNYLMIVLCAFVMFACDDKDKISNISVNIKVVTPSDLEIAAPESYDVVLVNFNDKQESKGTTDANGNVTITNVVPGIYTVTASAKVIDQGFSYICSGSVANASLVDDGVNIVVDASVAKSGTLVFKEIYYTGSRTPSNLTFFRDQFYELYNNSEDIVYADKLCIGHLIPLNATATMPQWDRTNPDGYIYFQNIFQIPGSGTDYPVKPGESIIIAQMAANVKLENWNPNSPVNLISAEFEAYTPDGAAWVDNRAINMPIVSNVVSSAPWQWLTPVSGPALAIFYPDETIDFDDYTVRVGSTAKGKHIPVTMILDAVEAVASQADVQLKRVPAVLDAGAVYASGTYVGEGFSRKIERTREDGTNVYQDTNNSTNDFETQTTPALRRYNAKIPSWNTWAN